MVGIVKWLRHRIVAPVCVGSNPTTHPIFTQLDMRRHSQVVRQRSAKPLFPSSNLGVASNDGVSPSGKATDSDSVMRRFESCYPSQ